MRRRAAPTTRASSAASPTYSALPRSAMGMRAPKVSSALSATGPVCRYGEEAKSAAPMGGRAAA